MTGDAIKTKLLQDVKSSDGEIAMYSNRFKKTTSNFSAKNGSINKNRAVRCYQCNKFGHFAKNCDKLKRDKDKNQNTNDVALYSALSAAPSCDLSKNYWYLDSAATIHMTNDLDSLENVKITNECSISTANDQKMSANKVGSVFLPVSNSYNAEYCLCTRFEGQSFVSQSNG